MLRIRAPQRNRARRSGPCSSIGLAGALSEIREQTRWTKLADRLARLDGTIPAPAPTPPPIARRQGWVWPAIQRVLAAADRPMHPVEVYAAVVEDLDTRLSKSTIKNELRRRLAIVPCELEQNAGGAYALPS